MKPMTVLGFIVLMISSVSAYAGICPPDCIHAGKIQCISDGAASVTCDGVVFVRAPEKSSSIEVDKKFKRSSKPRSAEDIYNQRDSAHEQKSGGVVQ